MAYLNRIPHVNDYEGITENSTNDEKLDVVFKVMVKDTVFNYIEYHKLKIKYPGEALFDARIEATGFVERRQPPGSMVTYRLTSKARLILDNYDNSYLKYLKANTPE